jgi:hypothetical protein
MAHGSLTTWAQHVTVASEFFGIFKRDRQVCLHWVSLSQEPILPHNILPLNEGRKVLMFNWSSPNWMRVSVGAGLLGLSLPDSTWHVPCKCYKESYHTLNLTCKVNSPAEQRGGLQFLYCTCLPRACCLLAQGKEKLQLWCKETSWTKFILGFWVQGSGFLLVCHSTGL